jgi:hypothetical protein
MEGTLLDGTFKPIGPDYKAPRNGRIKLGTESNGGFRNVTISNCVIEDCRGLALESVDGALLEDVAISNITMHGITDVPMFLRLGRRMRGPEGTPVGKLRRVSINNMVVSHSASRQACLITGIPGHVIEDVKLCNIFILHEGGGTRESASIQPEELENVYPDQTASARCRLMASLFAMCRDSTCAMLTFEPSKRISAPAFVLDDVAGADFVHVKAQLATGTPTFVLKNVKDFSINLSRPIPDLFFDTVELRRL